MVWIIVKFLSAVWTLILTAPIHCRWSTGEQVMSCYISPSLMKKLSHLHLAWTEGEDIFIKFKLLCDLFLQKSFSQTCRIIQAVCYFIFKTFNTTFYILNVIYKYITYTNIKYKINYSVACCGFAVRSNLGKFYFTTCSFKCKLKCNYKQLSVNGSAKKPWQNTSPAYIAREDINYHKTAAFLLLLGE